MKLVLSFLLVLSTVKMMAQNDFAVTIRNDTIYGKISLPTPRNDAEKILIKNDDGNNEMGLNQIISTNIKGEQYRNVKMVDRRKLMKVIVQGEVSLLRFRNEGEYEFNSEYLLKENGEGIAINSVGFKKKASAFLNECSSLSKDIKNKKYSFRQLAEIVKIYNDSCASNFPPEPSNSDESLEDLLELQSAIGLVIYKIKNNEPVPENLSAVIVKYSERDVNELIEKLLKKMNKN
jgi:hypothetical protein